MPEPDRTLIILREIRTEMREGFRRVEARMDREFSEIHDHLRRLDERIDGFMVRVEMLEEK